MKTLRRHPMNNRRGSALILVVLLTLVLAAMSIVALRDIARTTSATAVFRTRTQAQMASGAVVQIFGNYAGNYAPAMFQAGEATLYGDESGTLDTFGGNIDEGIDLNGNSTIELSEKRSTLAARGPVLVFDHRVLTSDCDGECPQMIPNPGGSETGLFRNNTTDTTFESQRTTEWRVVARDFTDGYPAVGYGEGFCFKKATIASEARVGEVDQSWKRSNNVGFARHGMDGMLGPVSCGYN